MQKVKLTHLALVLAVTVGSGCADDEKTPDKPAPASTRVEPAKPKPTEPESDVPPEPVGSIVIKGSKHKDSDSASTSADPNQQAKIDELKRKAAESQGKGEGGDPIRAEAPPPPPKRTRKVVAAELQGIDAQTKALEDERKSLMTTERTRRDPNHMVPRDDAAAARIQEIDQQVSTLKAQKVADTQELAAIDSAAAAGQ